MKDHRDSLNRARRKGEKAEVRVNKCRAKAEKIEDGLLQLEGRVGEVLEGNKALKLQIEGVGRQVQQLQQNLCLALHQAVYLEIKG